MPDGKVKLFVGAMVMLNNGQTFVVDTDLGDGSGVSAADSRTAPAGLPDNLKECWERCAYGFGPSPEELRALWSLTGFPLPSPRRRCNDCNCTGRVDGGTCPTCGSSGYLPVES